MLPEILLFGKARVGKDTVGQILAQDYGAAVLALADPMKRFAAHVFGFSEDDLWGPSESREHAYPRFAAIPAEDIINDAWAEVLDKLRVDVVLGSTSEASRATYYWLHEVFGYVNERHQALLLEWFETLRWKCANEAGITPRAVLQTLGTEFGRKLDDQVWVRYGRRVQRALLEGGVSYTRTGGVAPAPGQRFDLAVVTDGRFRNEALAFAAGGARSIRVVDPHAAPPPESGVPGHQSEREQDTVPDSWFSAVLYNDKTAGVGALREAVRAMMSDYGGPFSPPTFSTANFSSDA